MKSFFFLLACIAQDINGSTIQPQPSSTVSASKSCTISCTQNNPSTLPTFTPDVTIDGTIGIASFTALPINPQFLKLDWTVKFISSFQLLRRESISNFSIDLKYDRHSTDEIGRSYKFISYGNVSSIPPPISITVASSIMQYTVGPLEPGQLYHIKLSLIFDDASHNNGLDDYIYEDYRIDKSRNISIPMPACDYDCNEPKGIVNLGCTSCTCRTNSYGGNHCKDPMFASTITYIARVGQDAMDIHWLHNYDLYSDVEITQFTVAVTDTQSNMTRAIVANSNADRTVIDGLEEEVLYSIAVITDTTDDIVTSNAITAMIPNFGVVRSSTVSNTRSTVRIPESSPAVVQETTSDSTVGGIVVVVLSIFIISIHTCSPLVVIIYVQKRKIRRYEAQRAAALEPDHQVQDDHATLMSAYNIISHNNPSYVPSNNGSGSISEYQNSSTVGAVVSTTNRLYANAEVDAEHEVQSNTSTLTYDYVQRPIMQ